MFPYLLKVGGHDDDDMGGGNETSNNDSLGLENARAKVCFFYASVNNNSATTKNIPGSRRGRWGLICFHENDKAAHLGTALQLFFCYVSRVKYRHPCRVRVGYGV